MCLRYTWVDRARARIRYVQELKTSETEQKQAASLAADGWAREREVMRALHHKEAGELARNLKAVTAEAQFLEVHPAYPCWQA